MIANRALPSRHDLVDFGHAVAGHAGTMSDPDGELFVKPCTQREIDFYESATSRRHRDFKSIMPTYLGTLALTDAVDMSSIDEGISVENGSDLETSGVKGKEDEQSSKRQKTGSAGTREGEEKTNGVGQTKAEEKKNDGGVWRPNRSKKIETNTAVVLENSTSGFRQPNILDAKLGVRLYADYAPQQKKQRFDKISETTTHKTFGFRIAGMRVWKGSDDAADLAAHDDYKTYDKDFGRDHVTDETVAGHIRDFVFNQGRTGVDAELGRAVCVAFVRELRRIEAVLERNETRMFSASVLFTYEGDGDALRAAIAENNRYADQVESGGSKKMRSNAKVHSGIALEDEDDLEDDELGDDDDSEARLPKIFDVKLIDFAHATWTPGQGPDENSLKGVRSLIRIFEDMAQ